MYTPCQKQCNFHFKGIYVTEVHEGSPAAKAGLRIHDKILQVGGFFSPINVLGCSFVWYANVMVLKSQVNGYDFTMVTHKKAVDYIKKHPVLNMLVARKGVTHS